MEPSRDRKFIGLLALAVFIVVMSLLVPLSVKSTSTHPLYSNITVCAISAFNLAILFGWVGMGRTVGIFSNILCFIATLWFAAKTGAFNLVFFTIPFFATSFLGHSMLKDKDEFDRSNALKSEKLNEEINVLSNSIPKGKRYLQSLSEKLQRYATLKEVTEAFSTDLSLEDIVTLIIKKALDTVGKPGRMLLFMVDMKKEELILTASRDVTKVKTKKGDLFDHWVFRNRKPLIIDDVTKDFRFPAADIEEAKEHFRSLIETPLISENKVIGILRMDCPKESFYSHDDLRLLGIIADLGAVAVQNSILYSRAQELAIKDGLTGLSVRRYFMERFHEEIKRAARKKGELSLLILDIDHFKEYNDEFGHTSGDLVLKHLARSIGSLVREDDILARYGGEEFALLLSEADKERAIAEAEAMRKKIESEPFSLRRHKVHITISIGVSSYPQDATIEEELIKIADERLYRAKARGRNRVCAE